MPVDDTEENLDFPAAEAGIEVNPVSEEAVADTESEVVSPPPVTENSNYPFGGTALTGVTQVNDGVEVSWEKIPGAEIYLCSAERHGMNGRYSGILMNSL